MSGPRCDECQGWHTHSVSCSRYEPPTILVFEVPERRNFRVAVPMRHATARAVIEDPELLLEVALEAASLVGRPRHLVKTGENRWRIECAT